MKRLLSIITLLLCLSPAFVWAQICPGQVWTDTQGEPINAHGSCIVQSGGDYYWFGECRKGSQSQGISCYRSKDLYHWENLGLVLSMQGETTPDGNDIAPGRLFERPKVIFNRQTGKWVMWIHWENGKDYGQARVCVAQADRVTGPYEFYKTFRPNGHDSRDQTLFLDDDGNAYHFCSTDMNRNTNIALLRPDYLEPTPTETKILTDRQCEAASIFRYGNRYFGLFSGCTGWAPNAGRYAYADSILGHWHGGYDNFAVDAGKDKTYRSQAAYVLKVDGDDHKLIYIGDRWNPRDVGASLQVWLPISMRSGYPTVRWYDRWDLSVFDKMYRYKQAAEISADGVYALLEKRSNRLVSHSHGRQLTIEDDDDALNLSLRLVRVAPETYKIKDATTGQYLDAVADSLVFSPASDSPSQQWKFMLRCQGYYQLMNVATQTCLSVADARTEAGSGLCLEPPRKGASQYFAVFFDSDRYHYQEAKW